MRDINKLPGRRHRRPPIGVREAAAYLGVTERHVRRLVQERRIRHIKVAGSRVRFLPDELDAWLDDSRVEVVQ